MAYNIVGIGEILWDMLPAGKQLGGAPANFAYHAGALSEGLFKSYIFSSVGDDELGEEIISELGALNLQLKYLLINRQKPTGVVNVTLDKKGMPSYEIKEDVAWDHISKVPEELARQTDVVCFGSLAQRSKTSRTSILNFLKQVPQTSLKIFDINLRQKYYDQQTIESSLKLANVIKINDDELIMLVKMFKWDVKTEEDALMKLVNVYKLKLAVLTRGDKGSMLVNSNLKISEHPGCPTEVKDSIGAGDSFTAAVATGLLKGLTLNKINDNANKVAAYVCSQAGATPKLSQELVALFK
jgi:fructokinase